MNILIVDDSKVARSILRKNLESLDYSVVGEGRDGVEGLALYESLGPDLIITDLEMPNMNGLEMLVHIRKKNDKVRILILSSLVNKQITQNALLNGASEIMKKPISKDELRKTIQGGTDAI